MVYFSMSVSLLLLLLYGCLASSSKTVCEVTPHLMAMEPEPIIRSEAGGSETWNINSDLFQCAGVEVLRYTIQPNGLLLPLYINSDGVNYMVQGKSIFGLMMSGCPRESHDDNECQNILRFQKGDVIARLAGETIWAYNDGNEPAIIFIVIYRNTDIDRRVRRFFLAGSQKILNGFSSKFIKEAFNVDDELAMKLQIEDLRGRVVYATGGRPHLVCSPTLQHDQLEPKGLSNVVEESLCNINTRITNISDPLSADIFIPKVGYVKTIDAQDLSILESIQLSATYHLLLKDVMRLPHWENSYNIIYVMKGEGKIRVVDENGKNVFDEVVKEGQLLVVPKNFVSAELAKSKIFEYIIFKTNAKSNTSELSGRNSVIYQLPLKIVTNAYNITEEEANKVKFGRKEKILTKIMPKYL